MKSIVIYKSNTGNTERLAKAIHESLGENWELQALEENMDLSSYDNIAFGFFEEGGKVDHESKKLLSTLEGKKLGLFATAGFVGLMGKKTMAQIVEEMKEKNEVVASYVCQGRMSKAIEDYVIKTFPQMAEIVEKVRQPEEIAMPLDENLKEAKEIFQKAFQ